MALPSARDLVLSAQALPSPPTVYLRLTELMAAGQWNARDVAALIGADPALAARLLRLANSPFYAMPRQVADLEEAVVLLGEQEVRMLVLATSVLEQFSGIPAELASTERMRRRSLYCALAAGALDGGGASSTGSVAALLFDIGSLVVCLQLPEAVAEAVRAGRVPDEGGGPSIECAVTGWPQALVGAELLTQWRLPEAVVEAVRWSPAPLQAPAYRREAALVHVGSRLSAPLDRGELSAAAAMTVDEQILAAAGLADGAVAAVTGTVQHRFEALSALLEGGG